VDVFGNYVIQKFFDNGTSSQIKLLVEALYGNVVNLSLQTYGCRVVQKALEVSEMEEKIAITKELEGHVLTCLKDQNGNHVIQKIIEEVDPLYTKFIVDSFTNNVFQLSTHPYGCRIIQRIIVCYYKDSKDFDPPNQLVKELLHCTISLVQDQYGNYVVQHILKYGKMEDKLEVVNQLRGNIFQFSQHKFASNVIEQCVENGNHEIRQLIIDEILSEKGILESMMKHQYANYVVQKIIEVADPEQREYFVKYIKPYYSSLKKFSYGKHILNKLETFGKTY